MQHELLYEEKNRAKTDEECADIRHRTKGLSHPYQLCRPFAGGTDTAHTYFYLGRLGPGAIRELDKAAGENTSDSTLKLRGTVMSAALLHELTPGMRASPNSDGPPKLVFDDGQVETCPVLLADMADLLNGRHTLSALSAALLAVWRFAPSCTNPFCAAH